MISLSKNVYLRDNKTIKPEFLGKSNKVRMRVVDQTTLDALLLNDTIMLSDYKIIDMLQSDYNRSGMVGVKAISYEPRIKSSGFGNGGNLIRQKVLGCAKYIKNKLGKDYYVVLLSLIENKKLSANQLSLLGDKKKGGKFVRDN